MMIGLSELVIDDGRIGRLLIAPGRIRPSFHELCQDEYQEVYRALHHMLTQVTSTSPTRGGQ